MSLIKRTRFLLPLLLFIGIVLLLWKGLFLHPTEVPSPLVNKPAPTFELPRLEYPNRITTNKDFIGHITLLNVWASWCKTCAEEHAFLLELAKNEYLTLYGLNYKDNPVAAEKWLKEFGNPFHIIANDKLGNVSIDWGVYGTPETFLIDKKGIIRYKHTGPLTPEAFKKHFKPLIEQLRKESA